MLKVTDLRAGYGKVDVLHGISLEVNASECVALVGANGAGKSTTLKCICGLIEARAGRIEFEGQRIDGLAGHSIVRRGITMCPEGRQVFAEMSVLENLEMGAHTRHDKAQRSDLEEMLDLFPVLRDRLRQRAGTLSGGEQEMLASARALMSRPKILLIDEPSVGLAPILVHHVISQIKTLKEMAGLTVLMAEQNFTQAMRVADRGYLIVHGEIAVQGTAEELYGSDLVKKYYMGL